MIEEDAPDWNGLEDEELEAILAAADQLVEEGEGLCALRDRAILVVLLRTGLRVSELLSLDLKNYKAGGVCWYTTQRQAYGPSDYPFQMQHENSWSATLRNNGVGELGRCCSRKQGSAWRCRMWTIPSKRSRGKRTS